jgi:transposase-like protein
MAQLEALYMTRFEKKEFQYAKNQRRKFTAEFKSKVALEALSERSSINELAEKFDLNRNQVSEWKKKLMTHAHLIFTSQEFPENELNQP